MLKQQAEPLVNSRYELRESSWSWSYGSWIYNYLCNQCLSPITLWVRITFRRSVLDTTLCDQACQWLAAGRWISPGTPVSCTNKTDRHNITEILLKLSGAKHHNHNHGICLSFVISVCPFEVSLFIFFNFSMFLKTFFLSKSSFNLFKSRRKIL